MTIFCGPLAERNAAMANQVVSGNLYEGIAAMLLEIGQQLKSPDGYPFNPAALMVHLQDALDGRFTTTHLLRETPELAVEIPALRRPTLQQIQKGYPWMASIERDNSSEGSVKLRLTAFMHAAPRIDGPELERCIALETLSLLGYQHREWLLKRQRRNPALLAMFGVASVKFPGIVIVDDLGRRIIPCCRNRGGQWIRRWEPLDEGLELDGRLAVAASA
jgi:hypothetical protein